MNLLRALKTFSFSKFIEIIENKIRMILLFKYYYKKREIIRKSGISDEFFWRMIGSRKICDIRNLFFKNNIFAYSIKEEKEKIIDYIRKNCSRESKDYLNFADKVIRKEFDIFEKSHIFDKKINWHYSFFKGFKWKLQKSEEIDIRPKYKQVDVKYVWEFNRHQFMTYLGFAYYYTKNEMYAKEFKSLILDWVEKNPPLYGINWHSGLEISIRLISWIFTLNFFEGSKEINNDYFFKVIFKSMFQHAYYLKLFYTRNSLNHTIGELFGVYLFSKIFKKLKPFNKWENRYFKKFQEQIFLQTRHDGTNIEQSVNYHRFVLEFFSLFLILNLNALNKAEEGIIEKMYNYLLFSIKPNNKLPLIGDLDDGKVLLLTFYDNKSINVLMNLGAILFQRSDLKNLSKKLRVPSILLFGIKGYKIFNNLKSQEPVKNFKYFTKAGYFVMRNNWNSKANYLFIDIGQFGPRSAGHSHSSISNFVFSFNGKDIIIDSGTYTYNKSWNERNYYRSSKAHNVLAINQKNQSVYKDWFGWEYRPKIKRELIVKSDNVEINCFHDGYKGFIVHRKIIANKDIDRILIKDKVFKKQLLNNRNLTDINIYFHFNKDIKIILKENMIIINNSLILLVTSTQKITLSLERTFFAPNYGFKFENKLLNIHLRQSFQENEMVEIITEIKSLN